MSSTTIDHLATVEQILCYLKGPRDMVFYIVIVKNYKKMMFFFIEWMIRTVQDLPTYIHQEDIKRKQIKYRLEGKILYKKGRE